MKQKLFITDFDGTLAASDGLVSLKNLLALDLLAKHQIVRVIATGRNLYSVRKVIAPNFPVDYVIFTTGAGLMHWPTQKMILSHHLDRDSIKTTFNCFNEYRIDFMIHDPIPDNHFFQFFETGLKNLDFASRKQHYGEYCRAGDFDQLPGKAAQFLGVLRPDQDENLIPLIKQTLNSQNVVRATSPFDHKSIWVEVFSKQAAKHTTSDFLAQSLGVSRSNTFAIGNDYNDQELLNWAGKAFAVGNAIEALKNQHERVAEVQKDGFAEAVERILS